MKIAAPRGTYDIYGEELLLRNDIVSMMFDLANNYGFSQIQTPIFEATNLFLHSVGEETDIVSKEMYTFLDKKQRSMTLRPELTAPVVRSYIQEKMYATNSNVRLACFGPAFRYERPQAGRFRQFNQFGVESFGNNTPIHDAEIISLSYAIIKNFALDKKVKLKINSLGNKTEREEYIVALKKHISLHQNGLCKDCLVRYEKNPLRILDCKVDQEHIALKKAPKLIDYLSEESKKRFNEVCKFLDIQNIKYEIYDKLVRGLDYYNDTVFEFEYTFRDGRIQAILGGGRYDDLVETISGPKTSAFGFGIGIERITDAIIDSNGDLLDNYKTNVDVYFVPLCDEAIGVCFKSLNKLRYHGLVCDMNFKVISLKTTFKKTDKNKAIYAVIVGEDELESGEVTIKNLQTRTSEKVKLSLFEDNLIKEVEDEK